MGRGRYWDANLKSVFLLQAGDPEASSRRRRRDRQRLLELARRGDEDFATSAYAASKAGIVSLSWQIMVHEQSDPLQRRRTRPDRRPT